MSISKELLVEAEAFDARIRERARSGHIPDLQQVKPCDWFYNNPWRRPKYVDWVFGGYFRFALANMPKPGAHVLEVGSGPGHMSLEFARHGFHVTGLEISRASIEVAERMVAENPYTDGFGSVQYIHDDFIGWLPDKRYDAVCFFLTLHHFENPGGVLDKVLSLLVPRGVIVVIEPARDWFSMTDAAVVSLIRLLLATSNRWYEPLALPQSEAELASYVEACLEEYRLCKDKSEALQSPNDNASFAADMLNALRERFDEIAFRAGHAFVPRVIGGVRGSIEEQTLLLASFLRLFDEFCVSRGLLRPGAFYFAGHLRND